MFPLAFVAGSLQGHWWGFISRNYVVWPIFSLMNVFIALKGTQFLNFICFVFMTSHLLPFWWDKATLPDSVHSVPKTLAVCWNPSGRLLGCLYSVSSATLGALSHLTTSVEVNDKARIRNRYNRIPHTSPDTTRERNTNNQDCIKKTQHKPKAKRSALSQQMSTRLS